MAGLPGRNELGTFKFLLASALSSAEPGILGYSVPLKGYRGHNFFRRDDNNDTVFLGIAFRIAMQILSIVSKHH